MTFRLFIFLALILTFAFVSCNKTTPSGFWKDYQKDFLIYNISDQGPYGGHRAIYWKSEAASGFDTKGIVDFAAKNGWTLTDSLDFGLDLTSKWIYNGRDIFPLSGTGFSDTVINVSTYSYFPRWFGGQLKLYKFKTGWVTIEPGTDNSIEENGFVVLSQDKRKLAVYHLWGE